MLTLLRKRQQCRDVFWLKRGCRCVCGSCTLAVLVGCGLSSGLFVFLSFFSFTVASLQGVAQDSMLSCNHCLTLSLLSVIFSVLLKPPAASTALQPPLPPPVNLCRGSASLSFSGVILCLLFGWLAFFYLFILVVSHTPPRWPPCALPWFSAAPVYSSVVGQWVSVLFMWSCVSWFYVVACLQSGPCA